MTPTALTTADSEQLRARGLSLDRAARQLRQLASPAHYLDLVRPCTVGDGIERLAESEHHDLHSRHAEAAAAGRFVKFVPASGAASRMFGALIRYQRNEGRASDWAAVKRQAREGRPEAVELVAFLENLSRLPFHEELKQALKTRGENVDSLAAAGDYPSILDALLSAEGLDYASRPKGLLPFHRYPDGARSSFEEHLVEAAHYARAGDGTCALHYTVSPDHRGSFEAAASAVVPRHERELDCRFEIGYSVQKPSTDTVSATAGGRPSRDENGRLRFRPGGHGALIENLADLRADLVFVKNIDNVQPDRRKGATVKWKRSLAGHLVRLQAEVFRYVDLLRGPSATAALLDEVGEFAKERLRVDIEDHPDPGSLECRRALLLNRLNRPLRVCGVVPNTGEPGGGPFWVRHRSGLVSLQIVETAQIDPHDDEQQRILNSSTHFNPVDLVCGVSDSSGEPFDLGSFVDRDAVIVSVKSEEGREIRALELPGLWNGAMAGWNTVFVEVPIETFSPVKTVVDLLREEHGPG